MDCDNYPIFQVRLTRLAQDHFGAEAFEHCWNDYSPPVQTIPLEVVGTTRTRIRGLLIPTRLRVAGHYNDFDDHQLLPTMIAELVRLNRKVHPHRFAALVLDPDYHEQIRAEPDPTQALKWNPRGYGKFHPLNGEPLELEYGDICRAYTFDGHELVMIVVDKYLYWIKIDGELPCLLMWAQINRLFKIKQCDWDRLSWLRPGYNYNPW